MPKKRKTIRKVWTRLAKPAAIDSQCSSKHIREMELHLERWESFWLRDGKYAIANCLPGCKRSHMEEWRRHLLSSDLSKRTINKHLATIRRILVVAENHEIIKSRPRLEQLHEPSKGSRKQYLRNEQIDAMFDCAHVLDWPRTGIEPGLWWKCAIVMYRTYGFRTQELVAYESIKKPITWRNITFDEDSPNIASEEKNSLGWLFYVPPKTRKKKPEPIYIPLTKYARHALNIMRSTMQSEDSPIFSNPRHQAKFFEEWFKWINAAGIKSKDEDVRYYPYCLRKTCATYMNRHVTGLATAICRWGSSGEAKVASDHYISDELTLRRIHDAPMPSSFEAFLLAS